MSSQPLRIIFAGTPEFAATSLASLINTEHNIIAVYTQPDRPAGRGRKLTPSPVKVLAEKHNIAVYQPLNFKSSEDQQTLADLNADLMVVAAYGLLLPLTVLETPRLGCINIHASILPRWRGAAPIHRALIAGDAETGITIMQMNEGLDTGDMLLKRTCEIEPEDTSGSLHDRLAELGAEALLECLPGVQAQTLAPEPQDDSLACYATKLTKAEGLIDWTQPATTIERQVKGLNPWPVAYTELNGERVRVWQANAVEKSHEMAAGTIVSADKTGLLVSTGLHLIEITHAQLAGGKQLPVAALLNARQDLFRPGNRFTLSNPS